MTCAVRLLALATALAAAGPLPAQSGPRESFIICPGQPRCPGRATAPDRPAATATRGFSLSGPSGRRARAGAVRASPPARAAPATRPVAEAATTIHFDPNSLLLNAAARSRLDRLAAMLAAAPQARIVLEGHVALSGPPADHADLAGRRALAVADYLAARGIEAGRMDLISWGSSQPAAGGAGTQALSRRVVIRAAD